MTDDGDTVAVAYLKNLLILDRTGGELRAVKLPGGERVWGPLAFVPRADVLGAATSSEQEDGGVDLIPWRPR